MQTDNKKKAKKIKHQYLIFPFIIVSGTALFFLLSKRPNYIYILYSFAALILYFIVIALLNQKYVSFFASPDSIKIHYKSLLPFKSENNSIIIKANTLHSFDIQKSKKGKAKKLVLYQNSPGGVAKYPSVSLTAVDVADVEKIKKSLQLIIAMNKTNTK